MTEHMTCDQFSDLLSAYLERDVDEATRVAMESHAAECRECGSLLADLREVQVRAANLPEMAPSRDLWTSISSRIETPVIDLGAKHEANEAKRAGKVHRRWVRPSVAAAALVLVTAGVTHLATRRAYAPANVLTHDSSASLPTIGSETTQVVLPRDIAPAGNAKPAQDARATLVANKKRSAEQTYDQ